MLKRFVLIATLLLATHAYADNRAKLCKDLLVCGINLVLQSAIAVGFCPPSPTMNLDFITGAGKVLIMIRDYIPDCADPDNLAVTHMMLKDCQRGVTSTKNLIEACKKRFSH